MHHAGEGCQGEYFRHISTHSSLWWSSRYVVHLSPALHSSPPPHTMCILNRIMPKADLLSQFTSLIFFFCTAADILFKSPPQLTCVNIKAPFFFVQCVYVCIRKAETGHPLAQNTVKIFQKATTTELQVSPRMSLQFQQNALGRHNGF